MFEEDFQVFIMAEKVSASGLTLEHLQLAYSRGGVDAISNVLIEKFDGRARVTSNKRVIRVFVVTFRRTKVIIPV